MGKNIAIVVLLGLVAFFSYSAWNAKAPVGKDGEPVKSLTMVKQKVPVVIYSSESCRYCIMTKAFFDKKGVQYDARDINIGKNADEMMARTNGQRSIPQIFINHKHIGGWGELNALENQGKLNRMLLGIVE